ncbi:hypothetical protein ACFSQ3_09855 [Sphingobacterium corticis]|uniref:ABC transporter permease n=1 Tax=Sphingobacterium corticis TaxID=1812823 RepID=A0ABW5NN49_9SPHI
MNYYFRLRITLLKRYAEDAGIPFPMAILVATILLALLFSVGQRSPKYYPFVLIGLQFILLKSLSSRTQLLALRQIFSASQYYRIRFLENYLVSLPIIALALVHPQWLLCLAVVIMPGIIVFSGAMAISGLVVPTPFSKKPFEFALLFRKAWWIWMLLHALCLISLLYGNENLAFVLLGATALIALQAYDVVEDEHLVWNYVLSPKRYLWMKFIRGVKDLLIWTLPMLILVLIRFPEGIWMILLLCFVVILLLGLTILMKYSRYPSRPGVVEILAFAFSVATIIPLPLLCIHLYKKSVRRLKQCL